MTITDIESIAVFNGYRNFLFVLVHTDTGLVGIGESGLSGRELAVQGAIEHLRPVLIGEDPRRIEHLWQVMSRGAFFPAGGAQSAAQSAIDIALWDIRGKALGIPVHDLLGGRTRERVKCYAHVLESTDTDAVVRSAQQLIEQGWLALRCGIPMTGERICDPRKMLHIGIEQFGALRAAIGPRIDLMIDLHTRFDLPEAVRYCREIERFDPYFVEDPLRSEDPLAYRALRRQTGVPLAAGEQYGSKWPFRPLIEEDLIDYCRLDHCLVGGITESHKVAGWCEVHHIRMAVHNPIGPVATAVCTHLNLAWSNVGVQEQPRLPGALADVFPQQMTWDNGHLIAPDQPGLGITFDINAARKYPYQPWEPPQARRPDGSVTNW